MDYFIYMFSDMLDVTSLVYQLMFLTLPDSSKEWGMDVYVAEIVCTVGLIVIITLTGTFIVNQRSAQGLNQRSAHGLNQRSAHGLNQRSAQGLNQMSAQGLNQMSAHGLNQMSAQWLNQRSAQELNHRRQSFFVAIKW